MWDEGGGGGKGLTVVPKVLLKDFRSFPGLTLSRIYPQILCFSTGQHFAI